VKITTSSRIYSIIFDGWTQFGEEKGKTQERMERGSRKRSSSAGSEKMEKFGDG